MTLVFQVGLVIVLVAVCGGIAVGLLARVFPDDPDGARFLRWLFLASVLLRGAVAVGSFLLLPYGYLAPDEAGYVGAPRGVALTPAPPLPPPPVVPTEEAGNPASVGPKLESSLPPGFLKRFDAVNGRGWPYFNAALGANRVLPRLWNCVVGSLIPIFCYALAWRLGAGRAARLSAVIAALFPSLMLWSSLNLKDADVGFLIVVGLVLATQAPGAGWLKRLAGLALNLLIVGVLLTLREYAAAALATAVLVALITCSGLTRRVMARVPHPWLTVGAPIAALLVLILAAGVSDPKFGTALFRFFGLGQLAKLRHGFAVGAASATNPDPGIGTLAGALKFLPTGLVDFLLRPFPWEPGSAVAVLTRPETVVYYILIVPAVLGILLALRRNAAVALPLVIFLGIEAVGYALVISNLGTVYRERAPLLLILFVFVGVAIEELRRLTERVRFSSIQQTELTE